MEKPSLLAALLLACAPVAAAAEPGVPGGVMTVRDFLAEGPEARRAYVAGMADQLTFLADSALQPGLAWFPACLDRIGLGALEEAYVGYLRTHPHASDAPAARSFIWAAAERCVSDGAS